MWIFYCRVTSNCLYPYSNERAIQELLTDNLLKYNYFLTDARGRHIKCYMKISIPSNNNVHDTIQ